MSFRAVIATLAVLLTAAASMAADGTAPRTVYLYGIEDLEKLRQVNPSHYTRAQQVLAGADELCGSGPAQVHYAKADAKAVSCTDMLLKTSYPPKREIAFTLDDVRYVALVTVKNADASVHRVPLDRAAAK